MGYRIYYLVLFALMVSSELLPQPLAESRLPLTGAGLEQWLRDERSKFLESMRVESLVDDLGDKVADELHQFGISTIEELQLKKIAAVEKMAQKPLPVIPVKVSPVKPTVSEKKKVKKHLQKVQEEQEEPEPEPDTLPNYAYLGNFLKPWELLKGDKKIEINFENAELINLIRYFEKQYEVTFILDDVIKPPEAGARPVTGIKISFKTEQPLNKRQAWDIFVKFLDIAGLMVIPGPQERIYLITNNARTSTFSTSRDPVPTFIGIDYELLPTSDIKIRYVYFIQNTTPAVIKNVADNLKSTIASSPILIEDLGALILTDRASNIRSILAILRELDKPVLPETLTVINLRTADASKVKTLYDALVKEETSLLARLSPGGRKQSGVSYFTENVRVIADSRTNSLILLGPRNNVDQIELFVRREIDREIDLPYSPLHVYSLKYIDAEATAQILNELRAFQPESAAGATQFGGVIGGTKFLSPNVTITAEKSTNSLIVNADYEDYMQIYDLLQKIDTEQPQVALRILVLDVDTQDSRQFGIQFRNRKPTLDGVLGPDVNFQTSGLPLSDAPTFAPIVERDTGAPGAERLLGNLVSLASSNVAGSTLVTLGADIFGVWGVFKVLSKYIRASVVAKPFLVTTHKYNAEIAIQEVRNVVSSNIIGGGGTPPVNTFTDLGAGLVVNITPQISPDGFITLTVSVVSSAFTTADTGGSSADPAQGNRNERRIDTTVIVEDNQVLALGGLTRDEVQEQESKVPILGDIPVVGWFFKNKNKFVRKTSLLILISAEIINPHAHDRVEAFTNARMTSSQQLLDEMMCDEQLRDPIHTWFFEDDKDHIGCLMRSFNTNPPAGGPHIHAKPGRGRRRYGPPADEIEAAMGLAPREGPGAMPPVPQPMAPPPGLAPIPERIDDFIDPDQAGPPMRPPPPVGTRIPPFVERQVPDFKPEMHAGPFMGRSKSLQEFVRDQAPGVGI